MIITCPGCNSRYDVTGRKAGTRARCRCGTVLAIPKVSESAAMLKCPACGAPASPDSVSCTYCHTALAVVACPSCFGRVFVGSNNCQHCGAQMQLGAQAHPEEASQRECPRCAAGPPGAAHSLNGVSLSAHLVGETLLEGCSACGGVWLEATAFENLIKSRDEQGAVLSSKRPYLELKAFERNGNGLDAPRYVPCPECRQLMNRKNFGEISGVIVDVCKPHGIWFDRDELGRIIQFVMKGGLDESRRRELERMAHKLSEKRAGLLAMSSPMMSEPNQYDVEWLADVVRLFRRYFR
ncbi:MAG: zf-TFIIB domain-containing protein [Polyangiaceae bacterium]|nr:zf-TFIIB domain-containing protein [Polyangiaceae bacterium]